MTRILAFSSYFGSHRWNNDCSQSWYSSYRGYQINTLIWISLLVIHIISSAVSSRVFAKKLYFPACIYFLAFRMGAIHTAAFTQIREAIHVSPTLDSAPSILPHSTRHSESNCAGRIPYLSSKSKNTIVMGSSIPGLNAGTAAQATPHSPLWMQYRRRTIVSSQRHSSL